MRAKRALDRLALLVAPHARAVRDGREETVPAGEVVDGDVVALRPGDQVVADGAVVESSALMLDESQLTGESRAVAKGVGDEIMSGSFCVEGAGRYLVNRVGESSYASQVVGEAREFRYRRSPLELQINRLLLVTTAVMLPLGAAFVWVLIRHHAPFRSASATATAGIVTLVPEGLVLLTSLTFAVAAVRLSSRGMLVQAFNAVESLANVDTVCMDKTGTLTDGTLALHGVTPVGTTEAADAEGHVRDFAASTTSRNDTVDAIAAALPGTARPAKSEVPFSSRWKWSACRLEGDEHTLVLGAPDVLLGDGAPALVADHEHAGRRTLVLGRTPAELTAPGADGAPPPAIEPIAVIALEEHVRPEAAETIAYLRDQGVAVKVMSGDSPATVAAVAERAGIQVEGPTVDGTHLPEPGRRAHARSHLVDRLCPPLPAAQAAADRGPVGLRPVRGDDRRRRERRAGDEGLAPGDRARKRRADGQERGRQRARHRQLRRGARGDRRGPPDHPEHPAGRAACSPRRPCSRLGRAARRSPFFSRI